MANPQWKTIAENLIRLIEQGDLRPGDRIQSEEEIATEWGVSRQTAHKSVQELQRRGLVVRKRRWGTVVAAVPNTQKRQIGFLVDFARGVFQADLMRGIQAGLPADVRIVLFDSKDDPELEAEQFRRLRNEVDGVVCYPTGTPDNDTLFRAAIEEGYPLVLVDRASPGLQDATVLSDHGDAAERAVRQLVEHGHRRIAFFGGDNTHVQSVRERHEGYLAAVRQAGDWNTTAYTRWIPLMLEEKPPLLIQAMSDALYAMQGLTEPPTAAFCAQDCLTLGLIEACDRLGLDIPTDFEVATFNDFPAMMLRRPWRLHRVIQSANEIGRTAAQRLWSMVEGQPINPGPVRIPCSFVPAEADPPGLSSSGPDAPSSLVRATTNGGNSHAKQS
jgi:DNA-binding LacI/PurR family transcriptional regulator